MVTEPRIPPLDINNLDADAAAILQPMIDAGRPWNIFLTLAKHPDLAKRWLVFSNHVLFKSTLPPRERELAILRIGWLCQSEYEWAQHKIIGSDAGLEAGEIEKIKDGPQGEWSQLDSLVLKATDELHAEKQISEETWTSLLEFWTEQQLMDLVFAVGQYTLVSMALKTFGVPLDDFLTGWESA